MQKVFAKFFHPKPNKAHNSSLCLKVYDANDRAMDVEDRVDLEGGGAVPWRSWVGGPGEETEEEEEVIVY